MLIDVLGGGPGGEADVSRRSQAAAVAWLQEQGVDVAAVAVHDSLPAIRPGAVVVNVVHGHFGEDGQLQELLAAAGVPAVGCDVAASQLCFNKERAKKCLQEAGLPVPWGVMIDCAVPASVSQVRWPVMTGLVLKPCCDGSSVGLQMLPSPSFVLPALEKHLSTLGPTKVLIEERLAGPEGTVAVVQEDNGTWTALPPIMVLPQEGTYDYEAKYLADSTEYAFVDSTNADQMSRLALQAVAACGCRDLARVDVMRDADGLWRILEVNTLPGLTDHSLLPMAWREAGRDPGVELVRLCGLAARRMEAGSAS
jgi:D-alanine-D-alanine ligase